MLSDKPGLDREFPVSPVNQDREVHLGRTAVVKKGVEGRPNGPASEDDIVHQNDVGTINRKINFTTLQGGITAEVLVVVAIQRDVENPQTDLRSLPTEKLENPLGHLISPTANTHQMNHSPFLSLPNLIREPLVGGLNLRGIQG